MKAEITLGKEMLQKEKYVLLVEGLISKKYTPIIDPRNFDNPITIKARFKISDPKVQYIEISPSLEISMEHELPKPKAKARLKEISEDIETLLRFGTVNVEDLEAATIHMFSLRKPIAAPKDENEQKLFKNLEEKGILSRVKSIKCPACDQSFMLPASESVLGDRAFCVDCEKWFNIQDEKESYVLNEEYMKAMGSVWDNIQKIVRTSWREVIKRGLPVLKP